MTRSRRNRGGTQAAAVVLGVAVLAGAAGCGGGAAAEDDGASPAPPVVVRVVAGEGPAREVATGWVVGDGRVVTVAHAVDGARSVAVDGRRARVVARSGRLDVAVLAVGGVRAAAPRSADARAGQRATVWVLRDGRARRLDATVRRTITARVHEQPGDAPQVRPGLELASPIAAGDSGAPILDADGRLLGIAFARASSGGGAAYAVAGDAVLRTAGG